MPLLLSDKQIEQVGTAIRLLVSPMAHSSVNAWRSAVNRQLKPLVAADSVGFLLPNTEGPLLYSDEHDPRETGKYPDVEPPALKDGTSLWQRTIDLRVATIDTCYGADAARYWNSAYYNEFARPNGAAQTLGAMMTLGAPHPRSIATVQLWRSAASPRRFGDRDIGIVRLLFPALQAGIETYLRFGQDTAEVLRSCDAMGVPLTIWDQHGRALHQTAALTHLLSLDPEAPYLRTELQRMAWRATSLLPSARPANRSRCSDLRVEIRTAAAHYVIRASLLRASWAHDAWILVALERLTRVPRTTAELRAAYGLTPAEARVTRLLAEGRSNAQIAVALCIRPSTARRHTEKVLMKLGVRSRAEVAAKL